MYVCSTPVRAFLILHPCRVIGDAVNKQLWLPWVLERLWRTFREVCLYVIASPSSAIGQVCRATCGNSVAVFGIF
jgi:hypothetical protein